MSLFLQGTVAATQSTQIRTEIEKTESQEFSLFTCQGNVLLIGLKEKHVKQSGVKLVTQKLVYPYVFSRHAV